MTQKKAGNERKENKEQIRQIQNKVKVADLNTIITTLNIHGLNASIKCGSCQNRAKKASSHYTLPSTKLRLKYKTLSRLKVNGWERYCADSIKRIMVERWW